MRPPSEEFQYDSAGRGTKLQQSARADQRARRVYELRIVKGMSYTQIASELGLSAASVKNLYVRAQRLLIPADETEESRITALEKLNYDEQFVRAIMNADHVLVSFGKVVYDNAGNQMNDLTPKLHAIDRLLKIYKERRDILGYTAPSKRVLEVVSEDTFDKAIRELNERAAELEREAERQKKDLSPAESVHLTGRADPLL
jgi:hypothetical protein